MTSVVCLLSLLFVLQAKFYNDVIDDVISGIKDEFTEEGGDVQVLEELKKVLFFFIIIC